MQGTIEQNGLGIMKTLYIREFQWHPVPLPTYNRWWWIWWGGWWWWATEAPETTPSGHCWGNCISWSPWYTAGTKLGNTSPTLDIHSSIYVGVVACPREYPYGNCWGTKGTKHQLEPPRIPKWSMLGNNAEEQSIKWSPETTHMATAREQRWWSISPPPIIILLPILSNNIIVQIHVHWLQIVFIGVHWNCTGVKCTSAETARQPSAGKAHQRWCLEELQWAIM